MSTRDGLATFDAALAAQPPVLLAMTVDNAALRTARADQLPPLLHGLVRRTGRRVLGEVGADRASLLDRLAGLASAEQDEVLGELVRSNVATVLGSASPDAIAANRAFRDLGFDSLTAVELRNRLAAATGLRLPVTLVFDYPTTSALTAHLRAELVPSTGAATEPVVVDELRLRQALAALPLARLRDAGVLDTLLELADLDEPTDLGPAADRTDGAGLIDEMDTAGLVQLALRQAQS